MRPPVSLEKLLVKEGGTDTVVYRAAYSDYFHIDTKVFPAVEFPLELLQHLPDSRSRLLRAYGLYSSRARGTWARSPLLLRIGPPDEPQPELTVSSKHSRAAWASPIKTVYEANPLTCPRDQNAMKVIAVILLQLISSPYLPRGSLSLRIPCTRPSSALSPPKNPEVAYLPIVASSPHGLRHSPPLTMPVRSRRGAFALTIR